MPLLDIDRIIGEYYETIKDEYPNMTLDQCTKICKAIFWFTNRSMARSDMPTVHIKYFGKFVILPSVIKQKQKDNNYDLKNNRIDIEEHKKREQFLINKLKEIEIDYKQTIELSTED